LVLLEAVYAPDAPAGMAGVEAVQVLRATWIQQFYLDGGQVRWRDQHSGLPPGSRIILNPYDLDARPGVKRGRTWRGYKANFTETCEPDRPHLITHVATTDAATADLDTVQGRHAVLAARDPSARHPPGRRRLCQCRADPCCGRPPWRPADRPAAARHQLAGRRRRRVRPDPLQDRLRRPPRGLPQGQDQPQLAARPQPRRPTDHPGHLPASRTAAPAPTGHAAPDPRTTPGT
jgi:hypothetical protein